MRKDVIDIWHMREFKNCSQYIMVFKGFWIVSKKKKPIAVREGLRLPTQTSGIFPAVVIHIRGEDGRRDAVAGDGEQERLVDDELVVAWRHAARHRHFVRRTSARAGFVHLERGLLHRLRDDGIHSIVTGCVESRQPVERLLACKVHFWNHDRARARALLGAFDHDVDEIEQIENIHGRTFRFHDVHDVTGLGTEHDVMTDHLKMFVDGGRFKRIILQFESSKVLAAWNDDRSICARLQPLDKNVENGRGGDRPVRERIGDLSLPAMLAQEGDVILNAVGRVRFDFGHTREITHTRSVRVLEPKILNLVCGLPHAIFAEHEIHGLESRDGGQRGSGKTAHDVFL